MDRYPRQDRVLLWPLTSLFVIYAVSVGRFRLRHATNAAALSALVLAVGSGKLMQEDWLRNGDFDHFTYHLHLLAWLLIAVVVAWHIKGVISRGVTS